MSDRIRLARAVVAAHGCSFNQAKKWVASGKVFVDGERVTDPGYLVAADAELEVRHNAPRPRQREREVDIVFEDAHVVVIDKPSGISSVPYEKGERGTAMDALRDAWKRRGQISRGVPLHVVHRIDKGTSGLLVFAKTKRAEIGLARQLREHSMTREYVCVAHGAVQPGRIESQLVRDRGDGLRGSLPPNSPGRGKRAVTHVEVTERLGSPARATLCRVVLETGKTHQIRIHLAESGHPLVGETVYIRDYRHQEPIVSSRLLLHARVLGFEHPISGEPVSLARDVPEDFSSYLSRLRSERK